MSSEISFHDTYKGKLCQKLQDLFMSFKLDELVPVGSDTYQALKDISTNNNRIINDISKYGKIIKVNPLNEKYRFIFEMCVVELNYFDFSQRNLVKRILNYEDVKDAVSVHFPNYTSSKIQKLIKTIQNLDVTYKFLFEQNNDIFSLQLIYNTHKLITEGIVAPEYSGIIRDYNNDSIYGEYTDCKYILERLTILVDFVQSALILEHTHNTRDHLILAVLVFDQILQIHPFVDGNGRLARFLFAFIMKDFTRIPVSIFRTRYRNNNINNIKEAYTQVINKAKERDSPIGILNYILNCTVEFFEPLKDNNTSD